MLFSKEETRSLDRSSKSTSPYKGNGKHTFTMPDSKVTVTAEFAEIKAAATFADVPADTYYAKAVEWAVKKGITGGTGNGKFSPDATCTRAQAVTFLYRASGSPAVSGSAAFSDVAADAYYASAVKWAEKNGITGGIGVGLFGSDNNCTRGQIMAFLWQDMAE